MIKMLVIILSLMALWPYVAAGTLKTKHQLPLFCFRLNTLKGTVKTLRTPQEATKPLLNPQKVRR